MENNITEYRNNSARRDRCVNVLFPALCILLFIIFSVPYTHAGPLDDYSETVYASDGAAAVPDKLGEVIYRRNASSPNQLYIIGVSHRDTFTQTNGGATVQAQIETYRMAEWLMRNHRLELLLPEGFFSDRQAGHTGFDDSVFTPVPGNSIDSEALESRLGNDDVFVNAEMLLMENHRIHVRQVEDYNLYASVRDRLLSLPKNRQNKLTSLFIQADLNYLQEKRTAVMLQKIPGIIDYEYRNGTIHNRKALFTIGIAHINGIIHCLEQKKISIQSPAFTRFEDYLEDVNLLKRDFGVTIIIPRSLAEHSEVFMLSRLNISSDDISGN